MKQGTDVGCNHMKEGEFSVTRKQQNLKCGRVEERLQRRKVVDRKEEMKLRGMLGVGIKCVLGLLLVSVGEGGATLAGVSLQRNCLAFREMCFFSRFLVYRVER